VADESKVDRAAMAQAAQKLDDATRTTQNIRSKLQGHRGELLAQWQGNAAAAFGRVFDEFDQNFQQVVTAMEGMHGKLVQTRAKYEQTEEEQTATVNRVASQINN
jgi:WXG100 family type VII secretion target